MYKSNDQNVQTDQTINVSQAYILNCVLTILQVSYLAKSFTLFTNKFAYTIILLNCHAKYRTDTAF